MKIRLPASWVCQDEMRHGRCMQTVAESRARSAHSTLVCDPSFPRPLPRSPNPQLSPLSACSSPSLGSESEAVQPPRAPEWSPLRRDQRRRASNQLFRPLGGESQGVFHLMPQDSTQSPRQQPFYSCSPAGSLPSPSPLQVLPEFTPKTAHLLPNPCFSCPHVSLGGASPRERSVSSRY